MIDKFVFNGTKVEDNVLFYWAIISISRALRFKAEAGNLWTNSHVLSTVATYYSIFHLGMFLIFCAPHRLDSSVRSKINKELKDGKNDPRRAVSHKAVRNFFKACEVDGLPSSVIEFFDKALVLRGFANYGPDLRHDSDTFRVFNREYHPSECRKLIDGLDMVFIYAVEWACHNGADDGIWVPIAIEKAGPFFTDNPDGAPYYSEWSLKSVLMAAEQMRASLEKRASELIYPR